jgi:hypothetical protein
MSLNRLLLPFIPAEAGTQLLAEFLGHWIPAVAGMNGDWFNGDAIPELIALQALFTELLSVGSGLPGRSSGEVLSVE